MPNDGIYPAVGMTAEKTKELKVNVNPDLLGRRLRRLEAEIGSLSSEKDNVLQDLAKAIAELTVRVTNLESQAGSIS
jgi:hypothetical protein